MPRGEPRSSSLFPVCYQSVGDQFRHRLLAFCPTCERQSARPPRVGGRLGAAEHFGAVTPLSLGGVKGRVGRLDEPRGVGGILRIRGKPEADRQPPSPRGPPPPGLWSPPPKGQAPRPPGGHGSSWSSGGSRRIPRRRGGPRCPPGGEVLPGG